MMGHITWKKEYLGDFLHQWVSVETDEFKIRENYPESPKKYSLFRWDRHHSNGSTLKELKDLADEIYRTD